MSDPNEKLRNAYFFLDQSNGSDPNLSRAVEIILEILGEMKARVP